MAVHRKRPVPRPPFSGERQCRFYIALGVLFAVMGQSLAAHAQDAGTLSAGTSSFEAGKYDLAARQFTNAINSEGLAPNEAAKALFYRGLAYQRLKQPARAISDLGAAMWLGLSNSDRVNALVGRGLAYRAAGLGEQAEEDFSSARKLGGSDAVEKLVAGSGAPSQETAAASAPAGEAPAKEQEGFGASSGQPGSGFNNAVASAQNPSTPRNDASEPGGWSTSSSGESASGSRLSRWWSSVRGGSSSGSPGSDSTESAPPQSAEAQPVQPQTPPAAERPPTQSVQTARADPEPTEASPPAESSSEGASGRTAISRLWGSMREGVGSLRRGSEEQASVEANASAANAAPGYRLQLTTMRSEDEAEQLWNTVSGQNPRLAQSSHRVERTDMGDLGTFYRLQIGPFQDKAESTKLCNALKRSGVDCFLVAP